MKRAFVLLLIAAVGCRIDKSGLEPGEGTVFVNITDNGFTPDTIRVPVGRSVRWTNRSTQLNHAVQSDLFGSQPLGDDAWVQVRFDAAGAVDYFCPLHTDEAGEPIKIGTVLAE
ncbi:MAG: hypothetical protein ACREOK_03400 [Gemmatimonadaceae bacterium]